MSSIIGLEQALPYLRLYKQQVFVIKLGGGILSDEDALDQVVTQVALLHQLNIRIVLVHGGGPQATLMAERLGIPVKLVDGRRVTDLETLEVAKMVFNGKLNTEVLAKLNSLQVPSVGLSGIDSRLIRAVQRPVQKIRDKENGTEKIVDFGYVGDIQEVEPSLVLHLLRGSYVPVISTLADGGEGKVLNVNADTVAAELAIALEATKLLLLTQVAGVFENPEDTETVISQMNLSRLEEIRNSSAQGGMRVKLDACRTALEGGVSRAHIISGLEPDSLLAEIFTNEGSGTLIEES